MKINLAWLVDYVDHDLTEADLLDRINRQLGEIEEVEDLASKYRSIVIAKVKKVKAHPRSNKLKICLIDDKQAVKDVARQGDGLIQVVCGDKTVSQDSWAVYIPPKSKVPSSRLAIKAKEIRGVLSQGMLASGAELDFNNDQEHILVLQPNSSKKIADYPRLKLTKTTDLAGQKLVDALGLKTKILTIENKIFTQRPDCHGLLGLAREIATIAEGSLKLPDWYGLTDNGNQVQPETSKTAKKSQAADSGEDFDLKIDCPELVSRFRCHIVRDIKVEQSDVMIQARLASVGIRAVNNIVDLTNYLMYLTAQPSHAFDLDKLGRFVDGQPISLGVRLSQPSDKLQLLSGKLLTLNKNPALLVVANDKPVALAGIMGGHATEVDHQTKNVVIECANFDMNAIQETSREYGIFSEAATRFSRRQSPAQITPVLNRLSYFICQQKGSELAVADYDYYPKAFEAGSIKVKVSDINRLLGDDLSLKYVSGLLRKVGFKVADQGKNGLSIKPPFWRTDVAILEDVVEEVARLRKGGFQASQTRLPVASIKPVIQEEAFILKDRLRNLLASLGCNEVLSYSFVAQDFLAKHNQDPGDSYVLSNPLNKGLQVYRQSLTPSLLDFITNPQCDSDDQLIGLFEIGVVHARNGDKDQDGLPLAEPYLSLVVKSRRTKPNPFYSCRFYLDTISQKLDLGFSYERFRGKQPSGNYLKPYDLGRSAAIKINQQTCGVVGSFTKNIAGFEISLAQLLPSRLVKSGHQPTGYRHLSRYPSSWQDVTLRVASDLDYADLCRSLESVLNGLRKKEANLRLELKPLTIFQPPRDSKIKQVSFRLTANYSDQTITGQQVSEIIGQLVKQAQAKHKAEQVV